MLRRNTKYENILFAQRLSDTLNDRRLSPTRFSRLTDIPPRTLRHYMSGDTLPSADDLVAICSVLGCKADFLLNHTVAKPVWGSGYKPPGQAACLGVNDE